MQARDFVFWLVGVLDTHGDAEFIRIDLIRAGLNEIGKPPVKEASAKAQSAIPLYRSRLPTDVSQ